MTEAQIRSLIVEAGRKLEEKNLVQGTWGNISVRLNKDLMLITPSGVDYNRMREDDLILMNIYTLEYEGKGKPSSEKDLHAAIYRERKDIKAAIHSHPSFCSSIAAARAEVPVMSPEMQSLVGGTIKIAKYSLPSTKGLAKSAMKALIGRNGCILSNHGVMACGKNIEAAFNVINMMEQSARQFIEKAVIEKSESKKFNYSTMYKLFLNK